MKKIKGSGIFLLLFMSILLIGSTLLFFCKIPITRLHIPVFFILTSIFYYLFRKKEDKSGIIKVILLSLGVLIISIMISTFLFDRSSDGNTYHKDAIGLLKEGWNPVYQDSINIIEKRKDDSKNLTEYTIWSDHYAKANWIIASNFYSLTNNIESGKAMNLISVYILFSFLFTTLVPILNIKKSLILSLLTTINPVTASQLFTYYNDQLVCIYLFLAILFLIQLDHNIKNRSTWFYYSLTFIILSNMKFNGLGYLLVFSFLFVCRYLYKAYKKHQFVSIFKKLCIIFIPLFIISLVVVGYPTYIKNTIDHHNPFFPLYDKNGEDIITEQQPKKFNKMSNLEKLFYSTFSRANNLRENDNTTLKVPFMIYKDEIKPSTSVDLRISGWGIIFSGLLIISIFILIIYYKQYKKESWILYTIGITVLLLALMSESWWARYTPHFYLFVLISLYIIFKYSKKKNHSFIYILLITVNTCLPLLGNTYYTFINSIRIHKDLNKLRNEEIIINNSQGMNGSIYNLKDFNISYQIDNSIEGNEIYYHYLEYKKK